MLKRLFNISLSLLVLGMLLVPIQSFAAEKYTIKEMTLEVKNALESRRGRYELLSKFKDKGVIGENNQGYVDIRKDNAAASKLVSSENSDRQIIYRTIAEQNNLSDAIATIEKVFAQVQREKADKGHLIQLENGEWKTK